MTKSYDNIAVRTFLVPISSKGSALSPVHVQGCDLAPTEGVKTLEGSSLDEILTWWRANPCACWPTTEMQNEDAVEVKPYNTFDGRTAYSVSAGKKTILVTPPPRIGGRSWEIWWSDSIDTLDHASNAEVGIERARAILAATR